MKKMETKETNNMESRNRFSLVLIKNYTSGSCMSIKMKFII